MAEFKDRRSTGEKESDVDERETEVKADIAKTDVRKDGSVRRVAPGVRPASEWEKKQDVPMTRRDYLNIRATEEFSRREQTLWRRLWRRWTRRPPVLDMNGTLAAAHGRSLADIEAQLIASARGGTR